MRESICREAGGDEGKAHPAGVDKEIGRARIVGKRIVAGEYGFKLAIGLFLDFVVIFVLVRWLRFRWYSHASAWSEV